ncbi:MAG: N-acetyl-gamma-glutamyl-phosphate reductase [Dehalococcoidia bacterium]|nr:N-acetyl-gamma-glutamyl-phosphate reductase [Dehalococcoidia bacterium]
MIRAQLVGATGYGGLGMVELLVGHPEIKLASLLAKNDVGQPISAFFPHLRGICDLPVEEATTERVGQDVDLVICATPDRIGMGYAPALAKSGVAMLDYSGDFRFRSSGEYERYASRQPSVAGRAHTCTELLPQAAYGFPELFRSDVAGSRLVGNPGCFAVAIILGLAPALRGGAIDPQSVICDGKTGVSGAGKKPGALYHFPDANDNVTAYRIAAHQHAVEAMIALSRWSGSDVRLTFVPHLVPITRGIICTTYATLSGDYSLEQLHDLYQGMYADEPFVRVLPLGVTPGVKTVAGSNLCNVSLALDLDNGRLIVISAIDNLLKGQAGMALQNANVMFGLPETLGLERVPLYP